MSYKAHRGPEEFLMCPLRYRGASDYMQREIENSPRGEQKNFDMSP